MNMFCLKATIAVLLAVLPACTSQAPDAVWAEAELQANAGHGLAPSRTHDFERALVLAADHER